MFKFSNISLSTCVKCHPILSKIINKNKIDPFTIFNIDYSFKITNFKNLQSTYYSLMNISHPDKINLKIQCPKNHLTSQDELHYISQELTEKYHQIIDPKKRAEVLFLHKFQKPLFHEEKSIDNNTILYEIFELNEELDEILSEGHLEKLNGFKLQIQEELQVLEDIIDGEFNRENAELDIQSLCEKMSLLQGILNRINEA